jgi:hypothetical protein
MAGFAYDAAASGTISIPAGMFCKTISAHATSAGSMTIGGGASIPLPAGVLFTEDFNASRELLPGPCAIVFTGTDACYVSWGP